jgi:hypothetical protein
MFTVAMLTIATQSEIQSPRSQEQQHKQDLQPHTKRRAKKDKHSSATSEARRATNITATFTSNSQGSTGAKTK